MTHYSNIQSRLFNPGFRCHCEKGRKISRKLQESRNAAAGNPHAMLSFLFPRSVSPSLLAVFYRNYFRAILTFSSLQLYFLLYRYRFPGSPKSQQCRCKCGKHQGMNRKARSACMMKCGRELCRKPIRHMSAKHPTWIRNIQSSPPPPAGISRNTEQKRRRWYDKVAVTSGICVLTVNYL